MTEDCCRESEVKPVERALRESSFPLPFRSQSRREFARIMPLPPCCTQCWTAIGAAIEGFVEQLVQYWPDCRELTLLSSNETATVSSAERVMHHITANRILEQLARAGREVARAEMHQEDVTPLRRPMELSRPITTSHTPLARRSVKLWHQRMDIVPTISKVTCARNKMKSTAHSCV